MTFLQIFHEGGFIMYPLALFSIFIWAVAIKKFFVLASFKRQYTNLYKNAMNVGKGDNLGELKWLFKNASQLIAGPNEVLFDQASGDLDKDAIKEKVYRKLADTQAGLKEDLWILGTIGTSAPFVGLFGTVLGIMDSFKNIGSSGKAGFAVVAAGISEALIATAAGIIVAVVALLFYNYFQTKINNMYRDFRNKLEDFSEVVFQVRSNGNNNRR